MEESPLYSTIVLFGRDHPRSIRSPDLFCELVGSIESVLQATGFPLKCRGTIEGPGGRNLAPRKGPLNAKLVQSWAEHLNSGTFQQFEVFDAAWSDDHFPAVYAGVNKLWGRYSPEGYAERTDDGAENNVTVAVRQDLVADGMLSFEGFARRLAQMISAFYGFVEPSITWDIPLAPGGPYHHMIDVRWLETPSEFRYAQRRMDDRFVDRLYWGNVLCRSHFRSRDPQSLPSWAVDRLEAWGDNLFYVRFARDPASDPEFHEAIEPYFDLLPPRPGRL